MIELQVNFSLTCSKFQGFKILKLMNALLCICYSIWCFQILKQILEPHRNYSSGFSLQAKRQSRVGCLTNKIKCLQINFLCTPLGEEHECVIVKWQACEAASVLTARNTCASYWSQMACKRAPPVISCELFSRRITEKFLRIKMYNMF